MITAEAWRGVTVIFLAVVACSPLRGGSIHLYLLLGEACSSEPPSLTLCRAACGLADPWCGSNNPCSPGQQACRLQAAESGRRGSRGSSPGSGCVQGRDSGVSDTLAVSQYGRVSLQSVRMMDYQSGSPLRMSLFGLKTFFFTVECQSYFDSDTLTGQEHLNISSQHHAIICGSQSSGRLSAGRSPHSCMKQSSPNC